MADKKSSDKRDSPMADMRLPAALVRTALSSEQTLMSWVRTSLSLFTFGFSITQFFYFLDQGSGEISAGPRSLGMALVAVGIVVLLLAIVEHTLRIRRMDEDGLPKEAKSTWPIGSAIGLLIIGALAFIAILANWHF